MNKPLSKITWLWVPIILIMIQTWIELSFPAATLAHMHSEEGPHETLQAIILAAALGYAIACLTKINWQTQKHLGGWCALAAICCIYVLGEEISWGQHILQWSTPEYWAAINDQGETNLHNTSSWFDQKPRLLLLIGTITGGLIIPALQKYKPGTLPEKFTIIYPPATLGVTAAIALLVQLTDKLDDALTDTIIMVRASEVVEIYMFYFVMLYLITLYRRIKNTPQKTTAPS
jgi:hypothetical protein